MDQSATDDLVAALALHTRYSAQADDRPAIIRVRQEEHRFDGALRLENGCG